MRKTQTIPVQAVAYQYQLFKLATAACLILFSRAGQAQAIDTLWREGVRFEKINDDSRALDCFTKILRQGPNHIGALCKASRLYSRLGGRSEITAEKVSKILAGRELACKAILLDNRNAEAHFQYIVALGLLSEMADNPKEKLENARIIKRETEIVLGLDSNYAAVYYVLGKWHDVLSRLNWFERFIGQTLLGGLPPGASYPEALRNFQRAIDLQPGCILFYYGMANTLARHGQIHEALKKLEDALLLPCLEPDDQIRKDHCKFLIKEIKSKSL